MLAFLAAEPDLARLCLVESQSAGPVVAERFHRAVRELVPPLQRGRDERDSPRELPDFTEFILSPYLGPDEAARLAHTSA